MSSARFCERMMSPSLTEPLVASEGLNVDVGEKTHRDLKNIGYVGQ